MTPGEWIVSASIWSALACYPAGPFGLVWQTAPARRLARLLWTIGCLAFLVHVVSSFDVFYGWSHGHAVRETARQVEGVTGRAFGAGIYFNYLFAVVWTVDAVRWWVDPRGYRRRPWVSVAVMHGFFLFMIFNATVVFEDGFARLAGLLVSSVGAVGVVRAVRAARRRA